MTEIDMFFFHIHIIRTYNCIDNFICNNFIQWKNIYFNTDKIAFFAKFIYYQHKRDTMIWQVLSKLYVKNVKQATWFDGKKLVFVWIWICLTCFRNSSITSSFMSQIMFAYTRCPNTLATLPDLHKER